MTVCDFLYASVDNLVVPKWEFFPLPASIFTLNSIVNKISGSGCSKLMTLLVNVLLKLQSLISYICQYFLSKKYEKLLILQKLHSFFQQKISVYLVIKL